MTMIKTEIHRMRKEPKYRTEADEQLIETSTMRGPGPKGKTGRKAKSKDIKNILSKHLFKDTRLQVSG